MPAVSEPILLSERFDVPPDRLIAAVREQGLEGVVAKRLDSRYETGARSGAWLKYRAAPGQELVIGGYKPGANGFEYLLVGYYRGPKLMFVGKIRNGFVPALRRSLAERFAPLHTRTPPFANLPEPKGARRGEAITAEVMKSIRWLRPELVAEVEFTEWTANGHLRHARFAGLREDKDPREVVRESG